MRSYGLCFFQSFQSRKMKTWLSESMTVPFQCTHHIVLLLQSENASYLQLTSIIIVECYKICLNALRLMNERAEETRTAALHFLCNNYNLLYSTSPYNVDLCQEIACACSKKITTTKATKLRNDKENIKCIEIKC